MARREVRREAHAKVNVFLRVLAAREDGYHDLESLVTPISLSDTITVRDADALHVDVRGAEELTGDVPAGGLNLALVAALAIGDACPQAGGAEIVIDKRIPVAAGLGGGSADAAGTMLALNELWGCDLDLGTLAELGERLGSDVPVMLAAGSALMSGRGELIAPADMASFWWVLVHFDFGVRSPDAYRWWDEGHWTPGPDPGALLEAAAAGDAGALGSRLFNDLEGPVFARHPPIAKAKERLLAAGALGAVMSGSGSSVVGLAGNEAHARALAEAFPGSLVVSGPPSA